MADRGGFRSDAHVLFARSPGDADRAHGPPVGHERDAAPEHDEAIGLDDAVEQRGFRLDQAPPVDCGQAAERGDRLGLVLGDLGAQERGAVHPGQREQRARPTGTAENPQVVMPEQ